MLDAVVVVLVMEGTEEARTVVVLVDVAVAVAVVEDVAVAVAVVVDVAVAWS